MAKIYYTGDLHFGHFNAIKYDCRPWPDVETMAEGLIERWNARVQDDDLVYVLGVSASGVNIRRGIIWNGCSGRKASDRG